MVEGTSISRIEQVYKDLTTLKVKTIPHLPKSFFFHSFPQSVSMFFTIEHEEATTACSHDLASEGTIFLCLFIEPVDPGIRDFSRKILLCLPMLIKKITELCKVAILQRLLDLVSYL